ncbi:MAG: hypothetical protein AAB676_08745 [Verrucomicrobiota bacterium]
MGVLFFHELLRRFAPLGIDVAHAQDLRIGTVKETFAVSAEAMVAGANEAERDAVAGGNLSFSSPNRGRHKERHGQNCAGGGGLLKEAAPSEKWLRIRFHSS